MKPSKKREPFSSSSHTCRWIRKLTEELKVIKKFFQMLQGPGKATAPVAESDLWWVRQQQLWKKSRGHAVAGAHMWSSAHVDFLLFANHKAETGSA